jgi:Flp pilus assembly protein TadD
LFIGITAHTAKAQHTLDNILELLNQGEIMVAQRLLLENLEYNDRDIDSRVLLGNILTYTGKPEDAVRIWLQGLNNTAADYPLHMSVADARMQQASEVLNRKQSYTFLPVSIDSVRQASERNQYLEMAAESYRKAHELYPYEEDPLLNLARIAELQNKLPLAYEYWTTLTRMFPAKEDFWVARGNCDMRMNQLNMAFEHFSKALAINPRLVSAYHGMAGYWAMLGKQEEASLAYRKKKFYQWLPSFVEVSYSEENYQTATILFSEHLYSDKNIRQRHEKILKQLLKNNTSCSSNLLAALVYQHLLSEASEQLIIDQLATRNEQRLLMELAKKSSHGNVIAKVARHLVNLRVPGTFEFLTEMLPTDQYQHSAINVPQLLASLGNDLAIPYLLKELQSNPVQTLLDADDFSEFAPFSNDLTYHKRRVIMALAHFNGAVVIAALQDYMEDPQLHAFCAVALYKITKETIYLDAIDYSTMPEAAKDAQLADFLRTIGATQVMKLARLLD